ncbi:MAG: Zn-ribbon domain-containing OB-fold protein [Bacillota bacterium]
MRQRYRMKACRCRECGLVLFPPKGACPRCQSQALAEFALSGYGKVGTYTVIGQGGAPPEFAELARTLGSYVVAIVNLDEGPSVCGQVVDVNPGDVREGMRVRQVFRKLYVQEGVTRYGYKFRPVD